MIPGRLSTFIAFVGMLVFMRIYIRKFQKSGVMPIRKLPGLDAIDEAIGRATEMGKPTHYSTGLGRMRGETFAALEVLKHTVNLAAQYDSELIVTSNDALVTAITEEFVRTAYLEAGNIDAYKPDNVRYVAQDQTAYAGGVVGILERQKIAANIMMGHFMGESLIILEGGVRVNAMQIGEPCHGTASFFIATCDYVLIGEDLFAAGAYVSGDPGQVGALMAEEIGKYAAMAVMVLGSILSTFGSDWVANLLDF